MATSKSTKIGRRQFLRHGIALTLGASVVNLLPESVQSEPLAPRRRILGKTGLSISDISMGSGGATVDADLFHYAFDRGVNYFDTAETYPLKAPREAETALGKAFRGKRDKVVLTTKVSAQATSRRQGIMSRLEASLRRLQTDYVDIYMNHGVNEVARILNPEWLEFVELAKKQGKIRFSGMSGHAGHLIECLDAALDANAVDVILTAYNFGHDPKFYEKFTKSFDIIAHQTDLPRVLRKAHEKGVGVLAMKTLMGARLNDMKPFNQGGATFAQSAFRWVFSNPNVDGIVVTMKSRAMIDEYLAYSGQRGVSDRHVHVLRKYVELNGESYCRPLCSDCHDSCPYDVPISEVLRTRMYAVDYEDRAQAKAAYARLRPDASACLTCTGQPCSGVCPYGLDIPRLTLQATGLNS